MELAEEYNNDATCPMSAHTLDPEKFWHHNGSIKGVSITPIGLLGHPSADTTGVSDMGRMTEANRTRDPISGSVGTVPNIQSCACTIRPL